MLYQTNNITPNLVAWLESRNDEGTPRLVVTQIPGGVEVRRADGDELSELEQRHCRGTISAHTYSPLGAPGRNEVPS